MQLLLKHRYKVTAAVAITVVAVYMPFKMISSASTSLKAAIQVIETTVQTYQSSAAPHQQITRASNTSSSMTHQQARMTNIKSQPSPSPSPDLGPPKPQCIHLAIAAQPTEQELTVLLGHNVRALPPTDSSSPVLSTSNWEGLASKEHAGDQHWEINQDRSCATAPTRGYVILLCAETEHTYYQMQG
jgi:hypothetical protein